MNLPLVLDVVISLIFIYLVLSLLASEVQELIATVLQWRARHLRDSITNLLAGGDAAAPHSHVLDLVNDIYDDPLVKDLNQEARGMLAQGFRAVTRLFPGNRRGNFGPDQTTAPSYIPADTFAMALTERLGISGLTDRLVEGRLEKLIHRLIGDVSLYPDSIQVANPEMPVGIWEIAAQCNVDLTQDRYFRCLVEDCHGGLRDYRSGYADLPTSVSRLAEALDRYMLTSNQDADRSYFLERVKAFKLSLFGEKNDRVMLSAGLQPTLHEVAGLLNRGSAVSKELATRYRNVQDQAETIAAHVKSQAIELRNQAQAVDRSGATLDLPTFVDQVLDGLTEEEFRIYQDYQAYRKANQALDRLPDSLQASMVTLARRAQSGATQTANTVEGFRVEVASWFDNSMSRASGVYKRNAKGAALLIGFAIAAFTNADTFHILNRVSSDESLRKVITDQASQIGMIANSDSPVRGARRPGQIAAELEMLKNQTDEVLSDMTLPITWNPSNLSRQLGCPYDPTPTTDKNLPYALLTREQWHQLYRSCLNKPTVVTNGPIWMQVIQMVNMKPFAFARMLSGWFLSGIAIAMGAPFWFDLLGRLMNVRNTGGKPKSSNDRTTTV